MNKLSIRNVGPIKGGYGEQYIEMNNFTVFLGPQGSGKSTIAKIYSSLSWLQKAILREEVTTEQCEESDFFINEVISYQGIQSYFQKNSYVHFVGKGCEFKYEEGHFTVRMCADEKNFKMPKVMYVPAERNFITAIARPEFIKGLPKPLYSFLEEYEQAKQWVSEQGKITLPIDNLAYRFDTESNKSLLEGDDFQTDLLHGSSGFQSLVPLFIVTEYLTNLVLNKKDDPSYELFSVVQQNKIQKKLIKLLEQNKKISNLNKASKKFIEKAKEVVQSYQYKTFINIVEEPEQNLYPKSQKQVLFSLIKNLNKATENELIITSHSPYILNFITLCTEAHKVYNSKKIGLGNAALSNVVPAESAISIKQVNAYELDNKGNVRLLNKEDGFIDDSHSLNAAFEQINDDFSSILDMESE